MKTTVKIEIIGQVMTMKDDLMVVNSVKEFQKETDLFISTHIDKGWKVITAAKYFIVMKKNNYTIILSGINKRNNYIAFSYKWWQY